ncbi:MAG: ABC-2 transporter permease [Oscillospiraceae bacterium]|nr:ABC-2 transporter permease [Oscillospiraceae bacterium]
MSGLIFKDFYLNRKYLWFFIAPFLLIPGSILSEVNKGTPENSIIMTVMLTEALIMGFGYMLTWEIMKYDETKAWAGFIISTPQAARGQVASKYYFCLISMLAAFFISYIYNVVVNALTKLSFSGILFESTLFFITLLILAVEIPFSIRFGSVNGNKYRAMILELIIFAGMIYFLFGDLSIFGDPEKLMNTIICIAEGNDLPDVFLIVLAVFPYFSVTMFYLSYRLSCRAYTKGIESFEH